MVGLAFFGTKMIQEERGMNVISDKQVINTIFQQFASNNSSFYRLNGYALDDVTQQIVKKQLIWFTRLVAVSVIHTAVRNGAILLLLGLKLLSGGNEQMEQFLLMYECASLDTLLSRDSIYGILNKHQLYQLTQSILVYNIST
ncbi:hypothetical protein ACJX0J_019979 [Zea mays]